ncbi:unnamed protein product [Closterium sp. NIES-54]
MESDSAARRSQQLAVFSASAEAAAVDVAPPASGLASSPPAAIVVAEPAAAQPPVSEIQVPEEDERLEPWLTHVSVLVHLATFAIIGVLIRYGLEVLFGPEVAHVTDDEQTVFIDLPANIAGSFIMGVVGVAAKRHIAAYSEHLAIGLATGLCGCITTFASWNQRMLAILASGLWVRALAGYIVGAALPFVSLMAGIDFADGIKWQIKRANDRRTARGKPPLRAPRSDHFDRRWASLLLFFCLSVFLATAAAIGTALDDWSSKTRRLWFACVVAAPGAWLRWYLSGGSGGGQRQQQQRPRETLTPQQLREWFAQRGASGGSVRCQYVIRTGDRAGQTCKKVGHTQYRCFSRLDDAWRAEFGDAAELPRWLELLRNDVYIFAFDYDAILAGMHALTVTLEGDCYLYVPPDPGIEATALGASESALSGTAPAEALHAFTLDSDASRCFFRDSTTVTPLPAPVAISLADPSGGPVLARSSTVLPCPAVPSGSLSSLHLLSFSTNLVSTAALQDAMVTTTTPGGQRVSICTCAQTGRHLARFTRRPGSSLYTLITEPTQVAASGQASASVQVAATCSCRLLSHKNLLRHHRLGHPSLPCLRGMHFCLLVSGLPRSLPPLPPWPAPPCLPCVEGRQRAAPHSSSFPPTSAPQQTLHMDVKGEVPDVLIPWIHAVRLKLRERFRQDLPFLCLHSDRGGRFSSDLMRDFCRGEGILQSFTRPASPQQNGVAERRIGLVMEVARTSMVHAAAPHFPWPFAVRYAAHQLNFWPRVSLPETSATVRWTGEVGDASVFRVWGCRAFVRDTSGDKLSSRAIPSVFLVFPPDAPGWQFYHPTTRRVLPSQEVTFDESVPFYRLFPYRTAPLPPRAALPRSLSPSDPLSLAEPVKATVDSGAAGGGAARGAASRGSEPAGAEPGGAEPERAEPGGSEPESAEPEGAESEGAELGGY